MERIPVIRLRSEEAERLQRVLAVMPDERVINQSNLSRLNRLPSLTIQGESQFPVGAILEVIGSNPLTMIPLASIWVVCLCLSWLIRIITFSRKAVILFWSLTFYVLGLWVVAAVAESLGFWDLLLYKAYSVENSSSAIFPSLMFCLGLAWGDYMESRATIQWYPSEEFPEKIGRFLDVVAVVGMFTWLVVVPQVLASLIRGA